jgi:hypothetical protein
MNLECFQSKFMVFALQKKTKNKGYYMISVQNFGEILSYAAIIPAYISVVFFLISHRSKRNKISKQGVLSKEIQT